MAKTGQAAAESQSRIELAAIERIPFIKNQHCGTFGLTQRNSTIKDDRKLQKIKFSEMPRSCRKFKATNLTKKQYALKNRFRAGVRNSMKGRNEISGGTDAEFRGDALFDAVLLTTERSANIDGSSSSPTGSVSSSGFPCDLVLES
jgi:hypothetical protein